MTQRPSKDKNKRFRRALLGGIAAFGLLLAVMAAQAVIVRDGLVKGQQALRDYVAARADGDPATALRALARAERALNRAQLNTVGPHWWAASALPLVGDDVHAVRVIAKTADELASQILPDVEALLTRAETALQPREGQVELEAVEALRAPAEDLAVLLDEVDRRYDEVDPTTLVSSLRAPTVALGDRLDQARDVVDRLAETTAQLPTILGQDRPRTYLIAAQNNAELRATGGMPGALALLRADAGKLEIVEQTTAGKIGRFAKPVVTLTASERELWTNKPAIFPQDVGFIPDWPRAASILAEMVDRRLDVAVDGVLAVDPIALSRVLAATGPIKVQQKALSSGNVVAYLLNGIYLDQPNAAAQDAFYADTAAETFRTLLRGQASPTAILRGLRSSTREGRLLIWLRDPAQQELVQRTAIAGEWDGTSSRQPALGLFINSASADKLNYYLDYSVDVEPLSCADGRQEILMTATYRSLVPKTGLTPSIIGALYEGVNPGEMWLSLAAYGPTGGRLIDAQLNGRPMASLATRAEEQPVDLTTISVKPGEEQVVRYRFLAAEGQTGDPTLRVTPGARSDGRGELGATACR